MEELKKIAEKINSLSLRERAAIFIAIIALMFSVWDSLLMSPLEIEQKKIVADLNVKNAERLELNTQLQQLISKSTQDPDAENIAKLKSLRSRLIDVQAELETTTQNLVSPKDMPKILETVLHKVGGLTLLSLKSLGVKPLVVKEESEEKNVNTSKTTEKQLTADNIDNAYRHGIRIEFLGDYLTTLNYLKSLEALKWGFFWDNFELKVNDYPETDTVIEIFTLSLQQEWIGV